jgi:hypothetical protein
MFWSRSETTKTNYFETNQNKPKKPENPKFPEKIPKYAPYQTVSVGNLFVSVQLKHQKPLFQYRSETTEKNVLFRIVPKLVSVPASVLLTSFEGHPSREQRNIRLLQAWLVAQ